MSRKITKIPKLPASPADAHKGFFGKVLVVGGSRGMIGAPCLAANAALRSGAGLVRVAVPKDILPTVAGLTPCSTFIALAQDANGLIDSRAVHDVLQALGENDSVALGPGLGRSNGLESLVESIVGESKLPCVIDADGLNNLAAAGRGGDVLGRLGGNAVLTPHPGEMKRLWQACFRDPMPPDRAEQAERLAEHCKCVVLLKGHETVVTDGRGTYINSTGNCGMATAGSGDVLTGCIAALMARGGTGRASDRCLGVLDAAILGAHVHGRAGDIAAACFGKTSVIATDLVDMLAEAWSELEEE